jgi:flagellar biosynthetic protein FliP
VSARLARLLGAAAVVVVAWLALCPGTAHAAPLHPAVVSAAGLSTADEDTTGTTGNNGDSTANEGNKANTDASLFDDEDQSGTGGGPTGPGGPSGPSGTDGDSTVNVNIDGLTDKPSSSVTVLLLLTFLSLLPAIVLTCTSFTKVLVVLSLTRNALGLQQTPPNQVLAGLALFLSLFIMSPVLSDIYQDGVKPYLDGDATSAQAWEDGMEPLRAFMLENADDDELELLSNVADRELPDSREDTPTTTLIPAFILSELKDAFIIGFIIFIPFLIIDVVVSGALMALGMMMMPPVMVSLPFKLLLFVLVNGWGLVITALVGSYG